MKGASLQKLRVCSNRRKVAAAMAFDPAQADSGLAYQETLKTVVSLSGVEGPRVSNFWQKYY